MGHGFLCIRLGRRRRATGISRNRDQPDGHAGRQGDGQINRLKTIKRAMYGRAEPELLRARMMPLKLADLHTK
ncbi:hypothetical protein C9417_02455 [Rhizobium sp. SEMIA 4088]|nr:hypothetical protein C9417_02455 [Rhizobium sp. SEMIA 4088]